MNRHSEHFTPDNRIRYVSQWFLHSDQLNREHALIKYYENLSLIVDQAEHF
jgi:hypothetical protein